MHVFVLSQNNQTTNSGFMKKGQKRPYYGKRTKRQVIKAYFESSASMDELSEIHGVLGSNMVASWLKKSGNLGISKYSKSEIMSKSHSPIEEKNQRKKRFKLDVHLRIGELESDLETSQKKVHFYRYSMDIINDLAKELTGIDLLKKTGQELSRRSTKQES